MERTDAVIKFTCNGPQGKGCGKDISELVRAVPIDGDEHEVECPACSTVASVRRT